VVLFQFLLQNLLLFASIINLLYHFQEAEQIDQKIYHLGNIIKEFLQTDGENDSRMQQQNIPNSDTR